MPTPAEILKRAYFPVLPIIKVADSLQAQVIMLAIGLQESRFIHRKQVGGPAVGFWQFEEGGGIKGVLRHSTSRGRADLLCAARSVRAESGEVYKALQHDDVLAAGFARLLLLTDPKPLPEVGDVDGAWKTYIWNWRPGKPHPETWPALYGQAMAAVLQ